MSTRCFGCTVLVEQGKIKKDLDSPVTLALSDEERISRIRARSISSITRLTRKPARCGFAASFKN